MAQRSTSLARWLNRFAWFTAVATLLLICSGGMVTSKGVGLAVPDWPTTFGYNMFLFPVSKWIGGVLFEHTHRLIASTVGFLTIILAIWLWRTEDRPAVRTLGLLAVGGVILQGILGGLRVTMLKDQIGIFHACLAQAFLGLIVLIAIVTTDFWRTLSQNSTVLNGQVHQRFRRVKQFAIVATTLIYVQLALGATMRHQHKDLAILDFPTANGAWIPQYLARRTRSFGCGCGSNLAANGASLSRSVDRRRRDHVCDADSASPKCFASPGSFRVVDLVGRYVFSPVHPRSVDRLE